MSCLASQFPCDNSFWTDSCSAQTLGKRSLTATVIPGSDSGAIQSIIDLAYPLVVFWTRDWHIVDLPIHKELLFVHRKIPVPRVDGTRVRSSVLDQEWEKVSAG